MDTSKRLILTILSVIIFAEAILAEICSKYSCGALQNNLCTKKTADLTYTIQKCANSAQQCNFWESETTPEVTCTDKAPETIKLYPGGPCTDVKDCKEGLTCDGGKCVGVKDEEICTKHDQCNYGRACRSKDDSGNKYCLPQLGNGEVCKEDYDCVHTHGCYKGKCTAYFSLANGEPVEKTPPKTLSFCQSGLEYDNICVSLSLGANKDVECNDEKPCIYKNYNGFEMTIQENCACGLNPQGKKFCKLGNDHKEYKNYVAKINEFIKSKANCNTVERVLTDQCLQDKKHQPAEDKKKLFQTLTNFRIDAENSHELAGSDACVKQVAFPQYVNDNPPTPPVVTPKGCAKYTCQDKQTDCAHSKNTSTDTKFDINVVLSDICKSEEFCWAGNEPNVAFYKKEDGVGKCTKKSAKGSIRFPGEECNENDNQCWQPPKDKYPSETVVGTCQYGYCRGYNATESCGETAFCWAGNYCNAGKCEKQKSDGATCAKTEECQNHLLCFEGKCQKKWYSQPAGTDVSKYENPGHYCKFGIVNKKNICDHRFNADTVDATTKLVACQVGFKCNYTDFEGATVEEDCECGYSETGVSYCKKGHNQDTAKWDSLAEAKAKNTNNKCHSENRALCHRDDNDYLADVSISLHDTETAHLYYGAPKCALKVLSSSFINISIFGLFALLALLI